ncbi:MAG: MATE family efflux transporter [Rikenellaceae bacterium]|nr:MATE family efflux transporter [Rikenellaceae bacterium]
MNQKSLDFGQDSIPSLFHKMLIPTLLGALSICAVTLIDGIFIGQGVGAEGVAAINITVPIYQIMAGLGLMVGTGCSVLTSIMVARRNIRAARQNITQALVGIGTIVVIITLAMYIFPRQSAQILGASETLMPMVIDYLKWILPCFIFEMFSMIGLFIIRIDGAPKMAMWCNVIPSALNALLDWVFIFPLGMGVKGAAIATSISIIVGGIMALVYLIFFAKILKPAPIRLHSKLLCRAIYNFGHQCRIGVSSLLGELSLAAMVFIGNQVFMHYLGDTGVGAFGIACYYMPFFFMVGNSIAQSGQPIISYNYGIAAHERIAATRKLMTLSALCGGVIVSALFIFFPRELVGLFIDLSSEAATICIEGFPYFASGIIFFILNITFIGYYQSIERVKLAAIYVLLRGAIFALPSFVLLPKIFGVAGIWSAMPVTEFLTTIVILTILFREISNQKRYETS